MTTAIKKTRAVKKAASKAEPVEKAVIQVRVDAKTKRQIERLFKRYGMTTSDGVRTLLDQAIRAKEMPCEPNAESQRAIEESLSGKGRKVTMDDLRKIWDDA